MAQRKKTVAEKRQAAAEKRKAAEEEQAAGLKAVQAQLAEQAAQLKAQAEQLKEQDAQLKAQAAHLAVQEVQAEQLKALEPVERDKPASPDPSELMMTPAFDRAVNVAMELFADFIVYERHAPETAMVMLWPAFMHITQEDIDARIVARYGGSDRPFQGSPEDSQLIEWGIDDSIDILKKRTDGAFPVPGASALSQAEYEALSELALIETRYFYRTTEEDVLRNYIAITSKHAMRANHPPGTRQRVCVTAQNLALKCIDVLSDDSIEDKIQALIDYEGVIEIGFDMYFLRWREAGLL